MSLCHSCMLYDANLAHCKIGKRVHELYCSTHDLFGVPEAAASAQEQEQEGEQLALELEQLRRDLEQQDGAPLRIGRPHPKNHTEGPKP